MIIIQDLIIILVEIKNAYGTLDDEIWNLFIDYSPKCVLWEAVAIITHIEMNNNNLVH